MCENVKIHRNNVNSMQKTVIQMIQYKMCEFTYFNTECVNSHNSIRNAWIHTIQYEISEWVMIQEEEEQQQF